MEYVKIESDDNVDILVSMSNEIWSKHYTTAKILISTIYKQNTLDKNI